MLRKLTIAFFALLVLPVVARASVVVDPADYTGSRSTAGGLTATDGWATTGGGFMLSWTITANPTAPYFTYTYTFTKANGESLSPNPWHSYIETTNPFTPNDILVVAVRCHYGCATVISQPPDRSVAVPDWLYFCAKVPRWSDDIFYNEPPAGMGRLLC